MSDLRNRSSSSGRVVVKALTGLLAAAFFLGACSEKSDDPPIPSAQTTPGPAGSVLREAPGTVSGAVPLSPASPVPRDSSTPWAFLGEVQGVEAVGEITDFDVNDHGEVAFLDAMNHRVTVIRSTGEVSQLGSKGQGPGELHLPRAVALLHDGSVAVLDLTAGRITLWGPDAELVGTAPIPPLRAYNLATDGFRLATVVAEGSGIADPDSAGVPLEILRFDGLTPLPSIHLDAGERPHGGHGGSHMHPFVMLDEKRFLLYRYRGGYNMTLGSLSGGRPIHIARDVERLPNSVESFRRLRNRVDEDHRRITQSLGAPPNPRFLWSGNLPDSLPPMSSLARFGPFGGDTWGRIWVARGVPGPEGSLLDVFDREGEFLGEVHIPGPSLSGIRVRGSYAVGIHFGHLDEPSLLLFRILPEAPLR